MFFSNLRTRCGTFLVMLLAMTFPLRAGYTIYFEPYDNWDTVWTWIWDSNNGNQNYSGGKWPGAQIYQSTEHPGLYVYTFECTASNPALQCIFNDGSTNVQESEKPQHQTADFQLKNNWVYNYSGALCDIADYEAPDPGELTDYTIYFDNLNKWNNVYMDVKGSSFSTTLNVPSFLNGRMHSVSFEAPASTPLTCSFYQIDGSNQLDRTAFFTVINEHVYTISGDKGHKNDYNSENALPEAEYWWEPETPNSLQSTTLYFNKKYRSDSPLRNSEDIYLFLGLISENSSDTKWSYATPDWDFSKLDNNGEKYKMTLCSDLGDGQSVYSMSFTPSIAEWFRASSDERFSKLAFIIRDYSGTKQFSDNDGNRYLELAPLPIVTDGLGALQSYEDNDGTIFIKAEKGTLMITPCSQDIIKIFTLRAGASRTQERRSISVVANDDEKFSLVTPSYTVNENDNEIVIVVEDGVNVHVDKDKCIVSFRDKAGNIYLEEQNGLANQSGNVSVSFKPMSDEAFYGGGYNGSRINWNNRAFTMTNTQTGGWYQGVEGPHNICVPFYVSTRGYGVYFDDHTRDARVSPSSNVGTTYSSRSVDPISYYFIGGGAFSGEHASMEKVMQNYTMLTGLQDLPPYWALGYITSRYGYHSATEATNAIKRIKDECNIPLDGLVFDLYWQGAGNSGMGTLEWYTPNFPDHKKMMSDFKEKGVNTVIITEPYFTEDCGSNYSFLKDNKYLADEAAPNMKWLTNKNVGLIDSSNEAAMEWMGTYYSKHTTDGVAGWWLDLGEPEKHGTSNCSHAGGTCDQIHNEFGNLWTGAAYTALKNSHPEMRHILMPRAGTAGMQRYSTFPWTGDIKRSWEGLKAQIPALVSASMSGIGYLGSDIGGFCESTNESDELYLRWIQLGIFYPSMRTHAQEWLQHGPEPYNRPNVLNDVRDAINLRYAYLPYTYSQSYAYTRFGTPIARPANFADIDNPEKLADCIDAYLWGPDVYVAPVLDSSTSKYITFPEGEWLDMNDFKTVYASHQSVNYSAPTNVLPHFMRRGSFVTRYRQDKFTNTAEIETDKLTVDYFPTKSSTPDGSIFFDDDHKSVNTIEEGKYVVTRFSGKGADNSLLLYIDREGNGWEGMYETQDVLLRIHAVDMTGVNLDNIGFYDQHTQKRNAPMREASETPWSYSKIEKATSLDDVQNATRTTNAYYVDPASRTAYVRLPRLNPLETYNVELGEPGILTGIETPAALEAMTLAYGNGYFTYSAPQGTEDLTIGVFSVTGTQVALFSGLNADGYAGQIETDLPSGIYIARLTGRNSAGETRDKTIKMIVK